MDSNSGKATWDGKTPLKLNLKEMAKEGDVIEALDYIFLQIGAKTVSPAFNRCTKEIIAGKRNEIVEQSFLVIEVKVDYGIVEFNVKENFADNADFQKIIEQVSSKVEESCESSALLQTASKRVEELNKQIITLQKQNQRLLELLKSHQKCLIKQTNSSLCFNKQCSKVIPRSKIKQCRACQTAIYCSEVCQKADWNIHKHCCSTL